MLSILAQSSDFFEMGAEVVLAIFQYLSSWCCINLSSALLCGTCSVEFAVDGPSSWDGWAGEQDT